MVAVRLKSLGKRARSSVERVLYRGDEIYCVVCDQRARTWLRGRPYGRCPNCRCASRTRVLWAYLHHHFSDPSKLRILHFAPEAPLRRRLSAWNAHAYKTCDIGAKDVDYKVDIQRMPFDDASFDLVLCSHVLEHVPDDLTAMRELHRICSPGGTVLIQVPYDRSCPTREAPEGLSDDERKRQFGEIDHLRYYGTDLSSALGAAGFSVTTYEPTREVLITKRIEQGFEPDEILFVCNRSDAHP